MPILSIGTDIIEVERIKSLCERQPRFTQKVFTQTELDYSLSKKSVYLHLAGRFAAKEAVAKALGRLYPWKEVELVNDSTGKPSINLYGRAKEAAGNAKVYVSISHTENYASAVAVLEE